MDLRPAVETAWSTTCDRVRPSDTLENKAGELDKYLNNTSAYNIYRE